jgi:CHAT domain-containing protein/Flp pilus assembly protein TadD
MNRTSLIILLVLVITFTFSQESNYKQQPYLSEYLRYDLIYHDAEKLSFKPGYNKKTEELEAGMNKVALDGFIRLLSSIEKKRDDSLAFHCYFKIGTLYHYFDSLDDAQRSYQKAIEIKSRLPRVPDSFLFKPVLFSGSIYYNFNQFDSAMSQYKQAEKIAEKYNLSLNETNRLYNTLGALYYETGNYRQAKNYFEKSIALLSNSDPSFKALLVNYKINLASTLNKLEDFDKAETIYSEILVYNINRDEILHNLGAINLNLGASQKAINYFRKVRYNNNRSIRLYNDMALAYSNLHEKDSANLYIQKAVAENQKWNKNQKNAPHGLTLKYKADELAETGNFTEALDYYQQAITQFYPGYTATNTAENPSHFSGVFSYINLFNTLTAKADAFQKDYEEKKDIRQLLSSLNTYQSAFELADYVEKTYDSDEARLFLNKIKYTVHGKPIDVSLSLYDFTGNDKFLEEAYRFDQRNKASVLSFNVQENELRNASTTSNELLKQEAVLKTAITRLSLKASQTIDADLLNKINNDIRDYEIDLGRLQEKINSTTGQFANRIPSIDQLQKELDKKTALVSFHLSETQLLALVITHKKFFYRKTAINPLFFARIDSFKLSLSNTDAGQKYNGISTSTGLYKILLSPFLADIEEKERLIIIPDDELHYLPFEALQDQHKNYAIEKFSIQYQYSTAIPVQQNKGMRNHSLAFAPFVSQGYSDTTGEQFNRLPASKDEINGLKGKIFIDSSATKNNLLQWANHYSILHLATHASVNNKEPLRSFISFYPTANNPDTKLYAQEIYDLKLDSTDLVILSACETGTGQLVKGEGLMSLSRAFAYAGCYNIITSLWKAQDISTSFITQRLHAHLNEGLTKDKALQQAKLDLLKNDEISPALKTPNYWAHLVFIGQYEPQSSSLPWGWITGGLCFFILIFIL